ncbi:uncharacterized protein [Littorina saxatilis]|uniref:Leucine-rich repeat-containing protein 14 n=1 Tax=Littorina saxatilis TaxID=31220 RepID=A0AAN9AIK4_9CAEN
MSLTDVMDEVDYGRHNFNENEALTHHPLWMTESHFRYNLERSEGGQLGIQKDAEGEPICSPRLLKELVMQRVVVRPSRMKKLDGFDIPSDLYPSLLTEAIMQRSLQTVSYLVSNWPNTDLDVYSVLPPEDFGTCQQLTTPFESPQPGGLTLLDSFMVGLLNHKSHSKLKNINFSGFKHDRKLSRELARLPILWMKPSQRQGKYLHRLVSQTMGVSEEKMERYVNRINEIYANFDHYVKHGREIGPITIMFNCKLTLDDVPIGLALQSESPFRYICHRVWTEPISDVDVPLTTITEILDPMNITHLQVEDPDLCSDTSRWNTLLETIHRLPSLRALSLPNTVHVNLHANAAHELAQTVKSLPGLRRLNLGSCNLKDSLGQLLQNLNGEVNYLSLSDCRLSKGDVEALLEWPKLSQLQELNLSRNNLQNMVPEVVGLIGKMADSVVCFSSSFSSFTPVAIQQVVSKCRECKHLKILGIQSFVPPAVDELKGILDDCANIPTLQRCILLPEAYAFPGSQISQRTTNREEFGQLCTDTLRQLGRADVEVE